MRLREELLKKRQHFESEGRWVVPQLSLKMFGVVAGRQDQVHKYIAESE